MFKKLTLIYVVGAVACGNGSGTDPRCETLCAIREPTLSEAYDVCSTSSAEQCKQDCTAHIADAPGLAFARFVSLRMPALMLEAARAQVPMTPPVVSTTPVRSTDERGAVPILWEMTPHEIIAFDRSIHVG